MGSPTGLIKAVAEHAPGYAERALRNLKGPLTSMRQYFSNPEGIARMAADVERLPTPRNVLYSGNRVGGEPMLDSDQMRILEGLSGDLMDGRYQAEAIDRIAAKGVGGKTFMAGRRNVNGFDPMAGFSTVDDPHTIADLTDLTSGSAGDVFVPWLTNLTAPKEPGIGKQLLNDIRSRYPGTISLQPTIHSYDFYDNMGMQFDDSTGLFYLPKGMDFLKKAQGGLATKGPLNLMAPPTNHRGPFNIGMNSSNMAQKSRAAQRRSA